MAAERSRWIWGGYDLPPYTTTWCHISKVPNLGHVMTKEVSPWQLSHLHLLMKTMKLTQGLIKSEWIFHGEPDMQNLHCWPIPKCFDNADVSENGWPTSPASSQWCHKASCATYLITTLRWTVLLCHSLVGPGLLEIHECLFIIIYVLFCTSFFPWNIIFC